MCNLLLISLSLIEDNIFSPIGLARSTLTTLSAFMPVMMFRRLGPAEKGSLSAKVVRVTSVSFMPLLSGIGHILVLLTRVGILKLLHRPVCLGTGKPLVLLLGPLLSSGFASVLGQ